MIAAILTSAMPATTSAAEIEFTLESGSPDLGEPDRAQLLYSDKAGETNNVTVGDYTPGSLSLSDPGTPIEIPASAPPTTSQYCSPQTGSVSCGPYEDSRLPTVIGHLGAGDDSGVNGSATSGYQGPLTTDFFGGPGNDTLKAAFTAWGGPGNDSLIADTSMIGGPGSDDFTPPACGGTPDFACQSTVFYGNRGSKGAGISVTLDGKANDGRPGEGDNVHPGVYQVDGTGSDDSIVGDSYSNQLDGGLGADFLDGRGGDDALLGGRGNDVIRGGAGQDIINSYSGNDVIYARDGEKDTIYCGPGLDSYRADSFDKLQDCEIPLPRG